VRDPNEENRVIRIATVSHKMMPLEAQRTNGLSLPSKCDLYSRGVICRNFWKTWPK